MSYNYINIYIYRDIPTFNKNILKTELELLYNSSKSSFINKLQNHKSNQGSFSLTLDAWTASNQDAYLGITMLVIYLNILTNKFTNILLLLDAL